MAEAGEIPRREPTRRDHEPSVNERVVTALTEGYPLAVLRAPHGFGKSSAIRAAIPILQSTSQVVHLRLTPACRQGAHVFWSEVMAAFARAGLLPASEGDAPDATATFELLRTTVLAHRSPLVLIIDDYHHSGDGGGRMPHAEQLVSLIQDAGHMHVIIACRWPSSLEVLGAMSVDTVVLSAVDLALDVEQARRMAERRGLDVDDDSIERLLHELGGWPVAVRASLDSSARHHAEIEVDASFLDLAVGMVYDEVESDTFRRFVLLVAVPDEIDETTVNAVMGPSTRIGMLGHMYDAGILTRRRTITGMKYTFPAAVRASLLRLLQAKHPDVLRDVHRRLVPVAYRTDGAVAAIDHALKAQDWADALEIIEQDWAELITTDPGSLARLVREFPKEYVEAHPKLSVALSALGRYPAARAPELGQWNSTHAGYFETITHLLEGIESDEALLLMQWGIGCVLAADNGAATYAFGRVNQLGHERGDERIITLGAVGMVSVTSIAGEVDECLRWVRSPNVQKLMALSEADYAEDRVMASGVVVARVFSALAAVDAMAPEAAQMVADLVEPARRDDVWAMALHVRAQHAVVAGTREEIASHVSVLRAALRHLDPGGVTESTIVTGLAEVLVQMSMPQAAARVLDEIPESHVSNATHALVHLVRRHFAAALEHAERARASELTTHRSRLVAEVVRTSVYYLQGESQSARAAFDDALQIAREFGQRRVLALMPQVMVEDLVGDLALVSDVYRAEAVAGSPIDLGNRRRPGTGAAPVLSDREHQVAQALRRHSGPSGIAAELNLSVNTVKTHVQSVYRKLGAHGRGEALRLYEGLGERGVGE